MKFAPAAHSAHRRASVALINMRESAATAAALFSSPFGREARNSRQAALYVLAVAATTRRRERNCSKGCKYAEERGSRMMRDVYI